ncbi:MAG: L,D-transpeptidase [Gemmatimonadaceae bacterium]|nr:L,D-transpeptidase [Gemmatimonadaceae bacterium]NUQ92621.1 L,D-transpeptidase [Gemmatimonadaceae bacterium]
MRGSGFIAVAVLAAAGFPAAASAQRAPEEAHGVRIEEVSTGEVATAPDTLPRYRGRTDSLTSARVRLAAARARDMRVVVSVAQRKLWVLDGADTLRTAPVAVGMGRLLEYGGHRWTFATPRGVRTIIGKQAAPKWRPPEWAYAEVAREHHLKLAHVPARGSAKLRDGRRLLVRDGLVGVMMPDGFAPLPVEEHIVFDSTLWVPPLGSQNRAIDGELGDYQLDMGNGYLLHGTSRASSIGSATTHGCVRLFDVDLEWLYTFVPVGTKVYIY